MSDTPFITINDIAAHAFWIEIPSKGVWIAHCRVADVDTAIKENDAATIKVLDLTLTGTVARSHLDVNERAIDVIAGKAGWRKVVPSKSYASDSGVEAKLIADDLASDANETIADFDVKTSKVGAAYVRIKATAQQSLVEAIGADSYWWVDYDGKTHVAQALPTQQRTKDDFVIVDYDPTVQRVMLDVEQLTKIKVGDTLQHELLGDDPKTIERMNIRVDGEDSALLECFLSDHNSLMTQLEAAIQRVVDKKALALLEYTITGQSGNRFSLKPTDPDLPALDKVEIWAGLPGLTQEQLNGMRVLVGFIGGSRARPAVLAFAPPNGPDWEPPKVRLNSKLEVKDDSKLEAKLEVDGTSTLNDDVTINANLTVSNPSPIIDASSSGVNLMGGFDAPVLETLLKAQFTLLVTQLVAAFTAVGAGPAAAGAAGAAVIATFTLGPCGATQTKVT